MSTKSAANFKGKKQVGKHPKVVTEHTEHARLKAALKEIATSSGFKVDTEVALNFTGNVHDDGNLVDESSIDVAMLGASEEKRYLLIFECKGGGEFKEPHKKISAWEENIAKIKSGEVQVISSTDGILEDADIKGVDNVRVCYVFGKGMDSQKYEATKKTLHTRKFYAWDNATLAYYSKTTSTIGKAAKYQILRDFDLNPEPDGMYLEGAVRIIQGKLEMFLLGIKPSVLLKIAYVSRRASGKPSAYQRIVSAERIEKISGFLKSKEALLPNAIILAFDDEVEVQKRLHYEDGKFQFPKRYCSAWIIDGQHRIYGFLGTKYAEEQDDPETAFKLPVVAFKSMDLILQNRTFVSINYNQKKIDPMLLSDLATQLPDLNNELTWPSLLVADLNVRAPFKDRIRISELHEGRPITITSFAQYGLLEGLLGFDRKKRSYGGPLYTYAPFNPKSPVKSTKNDTSRKKQVDLLGRYFEGVYQNTSKKDEDKDPWRNTRKYALLKPTGINALLLVLSRILENYPCGEADIHKQFGAYLKPLKQIRFTRAYVAKQGGGWKGFRNLANVILRKLNADNNDTLKLYGKREKI